MDLSLNGIIPISRIKKCGFNDKDQMVVTIGNIEISTAFVPEKWLEVDTSPQIKKFDIEKLKPKNRLQLSTIKEINFLIIYGWIIVLRTFS